MPEYSHAEMHRIFRYEGHDPKNVGKVLPGPANSPEAGTQVLKDWNRRMESYYINGVMLKDILEREFDPAKHTKIWDEERQKEVIVFNDIQAIKEFFLHHLLLNDQERESWNHTKQQLEALNEMQIVSNR
ncbi:hypothetical protein [Legionella adelaidensis]|uniref:hypothetical protein n=1 Tax=Legionella adelaidensis TaxID=45056 RepID=UPI001131C7AC|nr:hypothetical protein [Legionella adelaidensis]